MEINAETLNNLSKEERDVMYARMADLKANLRQIDLEEAKAVPKSAGSVSRVGVSGGDDEFASASKTILRMLKPRASQSMSVDKWVEVIIYLFFIFLRLKSIF